MLSKAVDNTNFRIGKRYKGPMVDALAGRGDEGRTRLRKASGSCQEALIRGFPNGATQHGAIHVTYGGELREVKHLST